MEEKKTEKGVFNQLFGINVNDHTEKKPTGNNKELTYLSWPFAWAEVKKRFPDASYTIYKDEQNRPYIEDTDFGLMCMTTVTIEGMTHEMWLPVMDSANKAMRRQPYSYKVLNNSTRQYVDKWVQAATMFDINKTIMRCLVKNLAMFGLGLYIYAGEDLPETEEEGAPEQAATKKQVRKAADSGPKDVATLLLEAESVNANHPAQKTAKPAVKQQNLSLEDAKKAIAEATKKEQLVAIFNGNKHLQTNADFTGALTERKNQILNGNGKTAA